jgi:hypothetical protein
MRALDLMAPESEVNVEARHAVADRAALALGPEGYATAWDALSELDADTTLERLLLELEGELVRSDGD